MHYKPEHTEDQLLHLLKAGSEEAFALIFERYRKRLFTEAYYSLKNEEDALDVVQEVFVYLWQKRNIIEIKASLQSYLIGIVRYKSIDILRLRSKDQKFQSSYTVIKDSVSPTLMPIEQLELNRQLKEAVDGLSPKTRMAFEKMYLEQKSLKEISSEMGIQIQSAKNFVNRALKVLRKKLERNF